MGEPLRRTAPLRHKSRRTWRSLATPLRKVHRPPSVLPLRPEISNPLAIRTFLEYNRISDRKLFLCELNPFRRGGGSKRWRYAAAAAAKYRRE